MFHFSLHNELYISNFVCCRRICSTRGKEKSVQSEAAEVKYFVHRRQDWAAWECSPEMGKQLEIWYYIQRHYFWQQFWKLVRQLIFLLKFHPQFGKYLKHFHYWRFCPNMRNYFADIWKFLEYAEIFKIRDFQFS